MVIRLPRSTKGWMEQPQLFERYWDEAMTNIEKSLNSILEIPVIQAALEAAVSDVEAATIAAQSAADTAQAAADATLTETSLVNSYVSGFTAPLISADSSGNVVVANHTRVYGDSVLNPSVSVTGSTLATGQAAGSVIRVYYDDTSRAGGSVTYAYTVDPAAPPVQTGNRHSVGAVIIPASGTQDGNYINPPGYVEP